MTRPRWSASSWLSCHVGMENTYTGLMVTESTRTPLSPCLIVNIVATFEGNRKYLFFKHATMVCYNFDRVFFLSNLFKSYRIHRINTRPKSFCCLATKPTEDFQKNYKKASMSSSFMLADKLRSDMFILKATKDGKCAVKYGKLIDPCSSSLSRIFHPYGKVGIVVERLQI